MTDETSRKLIQQLLQEDGIDCFLGGEHAADLGLSLFEIKVMVSASDAERAGVTLTLEVHMNTIHDTAASAVRLLDAIDSPAVRANRGLRPASVRRYS